MAGYWEFPGGKCEPGEADRRRDSSRMPRGDRTARRPRSAPANHQPPISARLGRLYYYDCRDAYAGENPDPMTGFLWVEASVLPSLRFPEANAPILAALAREFGPDA